ncbi:hypothetical protein BKA81DRAFT_177875 [Phyllosticta paracitricarpa]
MIWGSGRRRRWDGWIDECKGGGVRKWFVGRRAIMQLAHCGGRWDEKSKKKKRKNGRVWERTERQGSKSSRHAKHSTPRRSIVIHDWESKVPFQCSFRQLLQNPFHIASFRSLSHPTHSCSLPARLPPVVAFEPPRWEKAKRSKRKNLPNTLRILLVSKHE